MYLQMNETTNSCSTGKCGGNANKSIGCNVTSCKHHCMTENYCSLDKIQVNTHEAHPTQCQCTNCASFAVKD